MNNKTKKTITPQKLKCTFKKDEDSSKPSSRRNSQIDLRRQSMRHVEKNDDNSLKVRRNSKQDRRTSLAELIPDWPVLTQRKKTSKVN